MCTEIKVYLIKVDDDAQKGSDDYTKEEFMDMAEEQGTVYSLKGFQDHFNYHDWSLQDSYIRII